MVYENGTTNVAIHPQVDSKFGFTCDEEILPFIEAFYQVGMKTLGSCQGIHAWSPSVVITAHPVALAFPRRWIAYTHVDPLVVFRFAQYIRDNISEMSGWGQSILMDHHSIPDTIFATLEFTVNLDAKMLTIIKGWRA